MSAGTSSQAELESPGSSSFVKSTEPSTHEESSTNPTEERLLQVTLPGMTLRGMALPERKLQKRDVRVVHNKNLSTEERKAIGERTKRVFAEKRAKRKLMAERLLERRRMKMAQRDANIEASTTPPMAAVSVPAIGEQIVSLEREGRLEGSFDTASDLENQDKAGDTNATDVQAKMHDKGVNTDGPGTAQEEEGVYQQDYANPHNPELIQDAAGNVFHIDELGNYHLYQSIYYYPVDPTEPVQIE